MASPRSADPRTAATLRELPRVREPDPDGAGDEVALAAVGVDLRPDAAEAAWLAVLLDELRPLLAEDLCSDAKHWLERGAFSAALAKLEAVAAAEPKNLTLQRVLGELRAAALHLVEGRLGGRHRRILAQPGTGELGPSYQKIVELAKERPTIGEVIAQSGTTDLEAMEHLAHLASHGWLLLAPLPSRHPPR